MSYPKIIYRTKNDKESYEELKEDPIFSELQNKDLFLIALTVGYKEKKRKQIDKKDPKGFVRTEYLGPEDWMIVKSVAIDEESEEVLNKPEIVIQIAEEYAHGGLEFLLEDLKNLPFASTEKWLEKNVVDLYNEIDADN